MKTRRAPNPLRIDPTRTSLLRRRYAAEVKRRFARLRRDVVQLALEEFGPNPTRFSLNAFCATGKGGGVDPHCSPGKGSGSASGASKGHGGGNGTAAGHEGLAARLRKLGAKAARLEHAAKAYVGDKLSAGVGKLHPKAQTAVNATLYVARAGTKAAFATWTAGQALAERVAKQRGHSEEQARRLRGVLSAMDVVAFKPLSLALGSSGIGAAAVGALSLIPPATAAYLAYSTARNPMATYRAARDLVGEALGSVAGRVRRLVGNAGIDNASLIADALEAHQWSDWYIALFTAALNATRDVQRALEVADEVFREHPTDPAADEPAPPTANALWSFLPLADKVQAFQAWFAGKVNETFAGLPSKVKEYVAEAFAKGMGRVQQEARRQIGFLASPAEKLNLLVQRAVDGIEGVAEKLGRTLGRLLSDGLAGQKSAAELAKGMGSAVDKSGKDAALGTDADIVRAHAEGQLDVAESLGVDALGIEAEFTTSGGPNVCKRCAALAGQVFTLAQARGLIPLHLRCRCRWKLLGGPTLPPVPSLVPIGG